MTLIGRKTCFAIGIPILLIGGCLSVVTSRKHIHLERDRWSLDYTHLRFFCKVCTATLNYVRYDGEDIPAPWAAGRAPEHASVVLHTPVGQLLFHSQEGCYRPWHAYTTDRPKSDEEITPEELTQG